MVDWIRKLLGLHVHEFSMWSMDKVMSDGHGSFVFLQHRICKKCGLIEVRKDSL